MKKLAIIFMFGWAFSLIAAPVFAVQDCGDVYPRDCPGCIDCGDGVVDLFDIQEGIDIILGVVNPTACQMLHGDVPNGMPPWCGDPSGNPNCETDNDMDIFDILIIIDKALGKANCCDYCFDVECTVDGDCDDGNECTADTCVDNLCNNICNATAFDDPCCTDPACISEYICGGSVSCTIRPEDIWVTHADLGFGVDFCLDNQNDTVRSVQFDVCEEIDGSPVDCLVCEGCEVTGRTIDFSCSTNELANGCCRVVVFNFGVSVINPGSCSIVNVDYRFVGGCPFTECLSLNPLNVLVADPNINEIESAGLVGEVCFTDFDNDGILNNEDNCPAIPNGPDLGTCIIGNIGQSCMNDNACGGIPASCSMNQEDSDGEGIGDACDSCPYDPENDIDNDNICGDLDNCPGVYNPNQEDTDGDGVGDVCDLCTDLDVDGYGRGGLDNSGCPYPVYDCNDNDPNVYPGATEVCNGIDEDCDTLIDEDLLQSCGTGVCAGVQVCTAGLWGNCSTYNNECNDCALCSAVGECDLFKAGSTLCRAAVGICDSAEYCTGNSAFCPSDSYQPNGTACDDNTVCNGHETCLDGACTAGVPLNCDDFNICTTDSCDAVLGCQYGNVIDNTACDDATVCNGHETCQSGVCTAGVPLNCDDGDECTEDNCDPVTGCDNPPAADGTACDDSIFCNGTDTCGGGSCSVHLGDPCPPLVCVEYFAVCLSDSDNDGIPDDGDNSGAPGDSSCTGGETEICDDNCPEMPNGFLLGNCAKIFLGIIEATGVSCTTDADCEAGESCQMDQEDFNGNGIGDVCECYADCNCDGKVALADNIIIRAEFGRTDCAQNPCQADLNDDGKVSISDLIIMKSEFGRTDCPPCL